jgi:hypothetical protein
MGRLPAHLHILSDNVVTFFVNLSLWLSVRVIITGRSLIHLSIRVEDTTIATRCCPSVYWLLKLTGISYLRIIILHALSRPVL